MESFSYDDIEPVKINEEQPQLCQILYDDEYKSIMGKLLALMKAQEYSERALAITEAGLDLLASHYTIWIYRYNIITRLDRNLFEELDWCETIALENEKNYQIWNYRQLIINNILKTEDGRQRFDPHREYPILNAMLEEDAKNHHVWSYRKWLIERFDLFDDERENEFIDQCLTLDLRNNSAWCHRFFLRFGKDKVISTEELNVEIEYVKASIQQCPQNESSWNYLLGIYNKFQLPITQLEPFCLQFANVNDSEAIELIQSSIALEVLAKIYNNAKSIELYNLLIEKYDPIRKNYWDFLKLQIKCR